MTRTEAFVTILRNANADDATIQEAIAALGDDPTPSSEESIELKNLEGDDLMDDAGDFGAKPENFAKKLPDGPKKDLLLTYAQRITGLNATAAGSLQPSEPASSPASASTTIDPLSDLIDLSAGVIQATQESTSPAPAQDTQRKEKGRPKDKQTENASKGEEKNAELPAPKLRATISRVGFDCIIRIDPLWPVMRDTIIAAFQANDQAKLQKIVEIIRAKREGQHGSHGRIFANAMEGLIADLRNGLKEQEPRVFRNAYWYP